MVINDKKEKLRRWLWVQLSFNVLALSLIIVYELLIQQFHPGLIFGIGAIFIFEFPLFKYLKNISETEFPFGVYGIVVAHWINLLFLIFLIILSFVFPQILFILIFGFGGLMSTALSNYGLSLLYLLHGMVWLFVVPNWLLNLDKKEEFWLFRMQQPFRHLKSNSRLIFVIAVVIYVFVLMFIYGPLQVFLIPTDSSFWNSWIFN